MQKIAGLHSAPGGVPSGSGGLADRSPVLPLTLVGGALLLLVVGGGVRVATKAGARS